MTQVRTLEEELQRVKENQKEKEKSLQDQAESPQREVKQKVGTGATQVVKKEKNLSKL